MVENVVIVIPARFASQRYPGKPLAQIRGAGGTPRTLIERSWRAARAVPGVARVVVATDDERIRMAATGFGAEVVMTPAECANGTERCAAALAALGEVPDIVVNLQGDAPLTPPEVVTSLVERMKADRQLEVCTPALRCSSGMLATLLKDEEEGRVGGTTVTFNANGDALYFSKRVIPYVRRGGDLSSAQVYLHLGVYVYRPPALSSYLATPPSHLESVEGLEQLRFLDRGMRVGVVAGPPPAWDLMELNNPEDLSGIEAVLAAQGVE